MNIDNSLDTHKKHKQVKKQKPKKRTLDEFKHWLSGLSEFQDDDWVPNVDQWEYIKASIAVIIEYDYQDEPEVQVRPYVQPQPGSNYVEPSIPRAIQSSFDQSNNIETGTLRSEFE